MLALTKEERLVLITFVLIFLIGIIIDQLLHKNPFLKDLINLAESDRLYPKLDINRATQEDLEKLPTIGPATAQQIIDFREQKGRILQLEEIKLIPGINHFRFQQIVQFLKIIPQRTSHE